MPTCWSCATAPRVTLPHHLVNESLERVLATQPYSRFGRRWEPWACHRQRGSDASTIRALILPRSCTRHEIVHRYGVSHGTINRVSQGKTCTFLGKPQNTHRSDPMIIPGSAVISRNELLCARKALSWRSSRLHATSPVTLPWPARWARQLFFSTRKP